MCDLSTKKPGDLIEGAHCMEHRPTSSVLVAPGLLSRHIDSAYVQGVVRIAEQMRPQTLVTSFRPSQVPTHEAVTNAHIMLDQAVSRHFSKVITLRSSSDADPEDVAAASRIRYQSSAAVSSAGFTAISPGWIAVCAQDSPPTAYAGRHAIGLARGWRMSMVCLGTPETGVIRETSGRDGLTSELWGIEVAADGCVVVLIEPGQSPRMLTVGKDLAGRPLSRSAT